MNIQGWFPFQLTGLISVLSKRLSRVFSSTVIQKHQFFSAQPSLWSNSHIHPYMTTGKIIALTRQTFVGKVMSLLFNTPSRFVIACLPKNKHLFNFMAPSTVILEPPKIKSVTASTFSPFKTGVLSLIFQDLMAVLKLCSIPLLLR